MAFWNRKPQQEQRYVAPATDSLLDEREDEAEQGLSNQQLLSALNAAQTALMMIDRDFKITYLNKQSMNLLKHHEALFKSVWPNFRAEEQFLMGSASTIFMLIRPINGRCCRLPPIFLT